MPGWQGWAGQVLDAMRLPRTAANLQFLAHDWYLAESGGGGGRYNPLNTTRVAPGLEGATNYNSAGVKNYNSPQQGLQATVGALSQPYYKQIVQAMASGRATRAQLAQLVAQSPWGTKHFPTLNVSASGGGPPRTAQASQMGGEGPTSPTQDQGTGNPYVDLVNKLESVYTGLGESVVPHLPPMGATSSPELKATAQNVSGDFGEFGKLVASEPTTRFQAPQQTLQSVLGMPGSSPNLLTQPVGNVPVKVDGGGPLPAAATPLIKIAEQYLGTPYVWGGADPRKGFDCSGLVKYSYAKLGIDLPHSSFEQAKMGVAVNLKNIRPGDLVFFNGNSHEGIYIGDGKFLQAPHTGDHVKISTLSGYGNISAIRRIPIPTKQAGGKR